MKKKKILQIFVCLLSVVVIVSISYLFASDNDTLPLFYLNEKTVSEVSIRKYNSDKTYELSRDEIKKICAAFSQMRLKKDFRKIEKAPLDILNPVVFTFETSFGQIEIYEAIPMDSSILYKQIDSLYWVNGKPYGTLLSYSSTNSLLRMSMSEITKNLEGACE